MDDWRTRLEDLINDARARIGDDAVRTALEDALERLAAPSPDVAPLAPAVAVLGVVACAGGWLGVLLRPSGQTTLHLGSAIVSLVEQVREQETLGAVGISVPVDRSAEVQAWRQSHPSVGIVDVGAERSGVGVTVPAMYSGMGFDESDLLEACGVAGVIARRFC